LQKKKKKTPNAKKKKRAKKEKLFFHSSRQCHPRMLLTVTSKSIKQWKGNIAVIGQSQKARAGAKVVKVNRQN
jgi:hypothetical protein